jgi:plastocyanin
MKSRFSLLAVPLILAALALNCGDDSNNVGNNVGNSTSPSPVEMAITIMGVQGDNSFFPSTATVQRGQLLEWRNTDSQSHDLVADAGAFETGTVVPGTTSSTLRISTPGTYHYHCTEHPHMVGSIVVTP